MRGDISFTKDRYGFWRQNDPHPIAYTQEYKTRQQTTPAMAWLRLGFLFSVLSPAECSRMVACDVGSGNGCFARTAAGCFREMHEYDLAGNSIPSSRLESTPWDVVFLTDVLEHYLHIDDLFLIDFEYGFLSFPETPSVASWQELVGWRHYKPDEHIWMLNEDGMRRWFSDHGYDTVASGAPEDAIRRTYIRTDRNITTMVVRRR